MRLHLSLPALLPLTLLLGCSAINSSPSYPNLNGNWVISAAQNSDAPPVSSFTGALQSSNSTLTGTLRASIFGASTCVSSTQDLQATGTVGPSGNLTLVIPISSGTATITATLPQNLNTMIAGSLQIAGGACAMPATSIQITQFAPVTGTYTGTLSTAVLPSGTNIPGGTIITAILTQSTTPNEDGQFPVSGTLSANGACSTTLSNTVASGAFLFSVQELDDTAPVTLPTFQLVDNSPTASALSGSLYATDCIQAEYVEYYDGTLTRQ